MIAPIYALMVIVPLAVSALAYERVDFFTPDGKHTGYAIVDRESGRVDFYDVNSRRTAWGRVDPSSQVERFGLDGRRQEGTALPLLTPEPKRR